MGSSAVSRTALGEVTNKVSANSVDGGAIQYSPKAKIRSCADNGAPGSPVGALLSAVGALKLGVIGQGGSSGAICKSDLKSPKFEKLATVLHSLCVTFGCLRLSKTFVMKSKLRRDFDELLLVGEPATMSIRGNGCKTIVRFNGSGAMVKHSPNTKAEPNKTR